MRDTSGEHCLFSVAVAIDPKPITLLISKGADPLIRNNQRRTVLHQVLQDFPDYEPDIAKVIAMFRTLRALLLHVPSLLSTSNDTALPADGCDCPCSEEGCLPTVTLMPVFRHQLLTLPRNVMWTLECLAVFRDLDRPDWVRQYLIVAPALQDGRARNATPLRVCSEGWSRERGAILGCDCRGEEDRDAGG